ncbi:D-tyrosyl-tRNA(Tyr) deacylase [Ahniella affigens]|uniref:D-aminoacyl-tRNA deacylase n=1 Tax=Ahniella affigens TaxID=2021234 RepID=A0A2P1PZD3_9GAMM|nr:D-aminoacyl-tRNA deacylase [Ahniella affigens]AVQ00200.1 D-tyrosyl-tRNA(Tyr) deacylase [Ahniella affigens]
MIALIQRVREARVDVADETVGAIGPGLLALVAIEPGDTDAVLSRMLERLLAYRVFEDQDGKMNRSLRDVHGGLLLVSQFTLAADTRKGLRPSFSSAAEPAFARTQFERLVGLARAGYDLVETGRFAANMQVHLINDGPVTFWLQSGERAA